MSESGDRRSRSEDLSRTPLDEVHRELDAKMVPFAGFEMPIHYPAGIRTEHRTVRRAAGLFDVSHMGEVEIRGPAALDLIQHLTVNDAAVLEVGQAQYSAMCREDGGILDDLLVYRFADHWMLVVNAANREKDRSWIEEHAAGFEVEVVDRSDEVALLAVQGPRAQEILAPLAELDLDAIAYYHFGEGVLAGRRMVVSRTGYTGEDGFELYVDASAAVPVWRAILGAGEEEGLAPAGLGARDSLRLEMGYALYGNDLDEEHTPLEAGLGWITKPDAGDFVGRSALMAQKERGVAERLVGLRLGDRGFPRPGYAIVDGEETVGGVTSGTVSPTLEVGIALGYVAADRAATGTELAVRIRDRSVPAVVERPPFYTGGSLRR